MTFKLFWIKVFKFETSYCLLMIVKTRNLINYTGTLQNYDKHVWWWKFSNTVQCLTLTCICYPLDKKMLTGWLGYQNLSEVVSSHIFEHLIYPGSSVFRSTKSLYCYPHQSVIIYCKLLKKFFYFFSETTWPIFIKLPVEYLLWKGNKNWEFRDSCPIWKQG